MIRASLPLLLAGVLAGGCASSNEEGGAGDGACTVAATALISDFEDGGNGVAQVAGRNGGWYTYNDKTGTQTPAEGATVTASRGAVCGSYSLRTSGMGFTMWGAGLGTDLASMGSVKGKHDASTYQGVSFFAKSGTGPLAVRFKVQTAGTVPSTEGGTCTGTMCNDAHGKLLNLTEEWQQIRVPFTDLLQEGWGTPVSFSKTDLLGVQLQVATGVTFDFSIDQVAFY